MTSKNDNPSSIAAFHETKLTIGIVKKIAAATMPVREEKYCLPMAGKLRSAGFRAEIYPDQAKLQKQMKWADQRKVDYVVFIGEKEMTEQVLSAKNMRTGQQETLSMAEFIDRLRA